VGTGYFDSVTNVIQQGLSSTTALKGSTEEAQFEEEKQQKVKVAAAN
jgi:isocitrate lyase